MKHRAHLSIAWSVCRFSAPCLNRATDLGVTWQIHLWPLFGLMTHFVGWCLRTFTGSRNLEESNLQPKHAIASNVRKRMICDSPAGSIDFRFRLLPNYYSRCYLSRHLSPIVTHPLLVELLLLLPLLQLSLIIYGSFCTGLRLDLRELGGGGRVT